MKTSLKNDLTFKLAELTGLATDEKSLKTYKKQWWVNLRDKDQGGLRLTKEGWLKIEESGIKCHKIKLTSKVENANQNLIKMDRFMDCPWYLNNKYIYVYTEKVAVQLILFSGNFQKFIDSKTLSNY